MQDLSKCFKQFCDKHTDSQGKPILIFFSRSQEPHGDNIARFRATAKVHKTPIKLRPIVTKVGTAIKSLIKWLDIMLQKVMKPLPWCIKNSDTFQMEILKIKIPPYERLVTFDTISMYSNIDLDHARRIMKHWLESYVPENTTDALPHDTILEALDLAMRHNICNSEIPTFYNWLVLRWEHWLQSCLQNSILDGPRKHSYSRNTAIH